MSVKRMPCFANSLQCGVGTAECALYASMSPQPRSSARMYTTFGRLLPLRAAAKDLRLSMIPAAPSVVRRQNVRRLIRELIDLTSPCVEWSFPVIRLSSLITMNYCGRYSSLFDFPSSLELLLTVITTGHRLTITLSAIYM
jgi:hypothetical protein